MQDNMSIAISKKHSSIELKCRARIQINNKISQMSTNLRMDTGASFTAIRADEFPDISEQDLIDLKCEIHTGYGISQKNPIIFYKIQLDAFSVAGMDFGSFPIYVTFDDNFQSALLGQDVLGLLDYSVQNSTNTLTMNKTERFIKFQKTGQPVTNPYLLFINSEPE